MKKEPGFLNVDLEIGARTSGQLAPLLDAFEGKLFELFRGRIRGIYRAHYESIGCGRDASTTIRALVATIEALDRAARRAWNAAAMRDFNIGVELARGVRSVELVLDHDVIEQVAALGGRIAFTAYNEAAIPRQRLTRGGTARPSRS